MRLDALELEEKKEKASFYGIKENKKDAEIEFEEDSLEELYKTN